jgi:hypothetical protein
MQRRKDMELSSTFAPFAFLVIYCDYREIIPNASSPILYTYLKASKKMLEYTPFSFNALW